MEESHQPYQAHSETPLPDSDSNLVYPPKPPAEEPKSRSAILLRSMTSLALYLAIGFFFFRNNWTLLIALTGIVIFHELGHFFAMKFYNYQDLGIFFIPLVGAYASGKKHEVSQLQSAIILLAGPVPGIVVGVALYYLAPHLSNDSSQIYLLSRIAWIMIFINLFNLLPVYPLDGGQLIHRLFLDGSHIIGQIFIIISAGLMIWFALYGMQKPFYPLLILPLYMLTRLVYDIQFDKLTQKVEAEGIDLNTSYEELSDEKYWKIRNILIRVHSSFRNIPETPPYEYSHKEEQIKTLMQNILQRTLLQDLSVVGKILIILVWLVCFAVPALIGIGFNFF
ncbi:MAG: site-2 protease family protein [Bacteroidetes bacterium]|nr:site-2 protease family protein [Bacteroidota bacterium]MBS1632742.1 site-2 protease family protein [Bacteroidota bacterium]